MKNQYFGDVNDYRKYGLLRSLASIDSLRIGVCWMLTPNDHRPDGRKTKYLNPESERNWTSLDPILYEFLQRKVNGHESEVASRKVSHFNHRLLQNAIFWTKEVADDELERTEYFKEMWHEFRCNEANVIFFDPDNGLANNRRTATPRKKGRKDSSKFLFRDEVKETLRLEMSVLIYQHFGRTNRTEFIKHMSSDLMDVACVEQAVTFVTPHVAFFLVPHPKQQVMLSEAALAVRNSPWGVAGSCKTCRSTERRHILVLTHERRKR